MAESSLSLSYTALKAAAALRAGYGRDDSNWTDDQSSHLDELVQTGYRWALFPGPNGVGADHSWSFLRPTTSDTFWADIAVAAATTVTSSDYSATTGLSTVTANTASFYRTMIGKSIVITSVGTFTISAYTSSTVIVVTGDATTGAAKTFSIASDGDYALPDDFGEMVGSMTFAANEGYAPLRQTSEVRIRDLRAGDLTTGIPALFAVTPRASTPSASAGQRWNVMLWPEPSGNHTLSYRYVSLPSQLSASNPYPLGGMMFGEVVKAAILAATEFELSRVKGVDWEHFVNSVTGAIARDRRQEPDTYGYNGQGRGTAITQPNVDIYYNGVLI